MGIPVALHGFGSGGTSLNFKVVGGLAQPAGLSENTIWVMTDVDISSYAFIAAEPASPEEGMVWFPIGTSSSVSFNALKKNVIEVYPQSAKQYIDGAWLDVTAKSYQNGEIVDWATNLFLYGDTCDDVTGGWFATNQSESVSLYEITDNAITFGQKSSWYDMGCGTEKALDLSGRKSLKVEYDCSFIYSTNKPRIGITSGKAVYTYNSNTFLAHAMLETGTGIVTTVDISNVDSGYITINGLGTGSIYKVWLE